MFQKNNAGNIKIKTNVETLANEKPTEYSSAIIPKKGSNIAKLNVENAPITERTVALYFGVISELKYEEYSGLTIPSNRYAKKNGITTL